MDQADAELKETITHIWPLQAKKMLDLLVPRTEELNNGKLSVGKIYGGLLILESWRNTKFGQLETDAPVSFKIKLLYLYPFGSTICCNPKKDHIWFLQLYKLNIFTFI